MDFWSQFWPQFVATIFGVGLGVYSAIWVNRKQEAKQEAKEYMEWERKSNKIIFSLQKELNDNFNAFEGWDESDYERSTLKARLKTETWKAFSEGGELKWIEDPDLLYFLSEAYASINAVKEVSEKYFQLFIVMRPIPGLPLLKKVEKDLKDKVHYAILVSTGILAFIDAHQDPDANPLVTKNEMRETIKRAQGIVFDKG